MPALQRTGKEIREIYDRHVDTVYRVCYSFMKTAPEAEDMVQETFLRLIFSGKTFENERHEKAWLIVTASNLCRDSLKHWWRRVETIDERIQAYPGRIRLRIRCWMLFWHCRKGIKRRCTCSIMRGIPPLKLHIICDARRLQSAAAYPARENNLK